MSYVKTAIATIFVLIGLLVGYMFFAFDSSYELNLAYDSFLKGEDQQAQHELEKVKDTLPADQLALYHAYISRALKQLPQSQEYLKQAASAAKPDSSALLEIRLNQALNAYLLRDNAALQVAVADAAKISSNHPWVVFFEALERFESADYLKAMELWSVRSERTPLSGWMKKSFDSIFTRPWMVLTLSRCQIEVGKYLIARQTLEEEFEGANEPEATEINFLLGLSYAKEAQEKTPSGAAPYWKLAMSYLNRVPLQNERYNTDRQQLIAIVEKLVKQLLEAKSYNDLPFYASALQGWGADKTLNDMASVVITHLNQALNDHQWKRVEELAVLLNRMLPDGDNRQNLQRRFQALAANALSGANIEQVTEYWAVAHLLSSNPDQMASDFAAKTAAKIVALLPNDDATLSKTMPYLRFWADIDKSPDSRLTFATSLLVEAENAWLTPGGENKAQQIITAASSLVPTESSAAFNEQIQKLIVRVYEEISKRDDVEKLPSLTEVAKRYHVILDISSDAQLQKHAASAQELLRQGRYDEALSRAQWILSFKPEDPQASFIAGIILYEKADYFKAKQLLSSLTNPTPAVREALAVSQFLTGDTEQGMVTINELKSKRMLQDDTLLRLGLGLLIQGKPTDALVWLQQINQKMPEVLIAKAYADYLLKQYDNITVDLRQLPTPYSGLDGVRGLAIQTDIALGHLDEAEQALVKLLRQPEQPPTAGFSAAFQQFDQLRFSELSRYFLAGLFFRDIRKNNEAAVKYFRLIKNPTPGMLIVRGETLQALGHNDEAIADLKVAVDQGIDPIARLKAIPLLAMALEARQRRLEALTMFQYYYQLQPNSNEFRAQYARLLQKLRRYDLALEQYSKLGTWDKLSPEDIVGYATSQFNLGHSNEAVKIGNQFLDSLPPKPIAQQLAMSRLMAKVDNLKSTWPILKTLPPVGQLSLDEAMELAQFLMEIASYNQVATVISAKSKEFQSNVKGLTILAEFADRLGRNQEAIGYIQAAKKLDPNNFDLDAALAYYTRTIAGREAIVSDLSRRTQQEPLDTSLRLAYTHQLAWLGNLARSIDKRNSDRYQSEYQKGTFWLEKTTKVYGEIPEVRCIMGELLSLLNKPKESIIAFRDTLTLDPSYAEAAVSLANIYATEKDRKSAIRMLFQATQYEPDNAQTWVKLANLYRDDGNLYEASHYYQSALKFSPNDIELYITLAKVFLEVRNPEDAKVVLEHAVALAPKNIVALSLLLQNLHDPMLSASDDEAKELAAEQQKVYMQLHSLDPKGAEKLLTAISQGSQSEEDLPPLDLHDSNPQLNKVSEDISKYLTDPDSKDVDPKYQSGAPLHDSTVPSKYFDDIGPDQH